MKKTLIELLFTSAGANKARDSSCDLVRNIVKAANNDSNPLGNKNFGIIDNDNKSIVNEIGIIQFDL